MNLANPDLAPLATTPASAPPLLEIRDLRVGFESADGDRVVVAVDGVSLQVPAGATLGLVGESGSGKSVTCLSVLRLLAEKGRILGGEVRFGGRDLLSLSHEELQSLRGGEIAMIFQDPMSSLNPVKRVGWQIAEALMIHEALGVRAAEEMAVELLSQVGIPEPKLRARAFPHQLSGGMCQRVMIAMALACRPKLLIAD
ncbi:MAG: ABC transporter ATP-binding protein, partial [Pseudomonadota bacterium]